MIVLEYNAQALDAAIAADMSLRYLSADRLLVLTQPVPDYVAPRIPAKPAYIVEPFPNWPDLDDDEARQLIAYQASALGASDGWTAGKRNQALTDAAQQFYQGAGGFYDLLAWRWAVRDLLPASFSSWTSLETAIAIELDIRNDVDAEKTTYQEGLGLSSADASARIQGFTAWNEPIIAESVTGRLNDPAYNAILTKYLDSVDRDDFRSVTSGLESAARETGRLGIGYDDRETVAGLVNFIEANDVYTSAGGLDDQGYVVRTGTMADLQNELTTHLLNP